MGKWTALWLIWAAFAGAIEGTALLTKAPNATLTAHIVEWASLSNKSKGWLARRGVLVGFFGWLVYHFISKVAW